MEPLDELHMRKCLQSYFWCLCQCLLWPIFRYQVISLMARILLVNLSALCYFFWTWSLFSMHKPNLKPKTVDVLTIRWGHVHPHQPLQSVNLSLFVFYFSWCCFCLFLWYTSVTILKSCSRVSKSTILYNQLIMFDVFNIHVAKANLKVCVCFMGKKYMDCLNCYFVSKT